MDQRICNFAWVFIALIGFLTSELPSTAEKSTPWVLDAQLLLCQSLVIHLFLGCEPRLHSTLLHSGNKDIVSSCGAAQSWVLQKCCLICLWFEELSSLLSERKAVENMSQFKLFFFFKGAFACVVVTKPCQIALVCITSVCFQYCLHSSAHKQHDLVYRSRFTCSRHWWSFHCNPHMTINHLQMGEQHSSVKKEVWKCILKLFYKLIT